MIKNYFIFISLVFVNYYYAQNDTNKTIKKDRPTIFIEHDLSGGINWLYNNFKAKKTTYDSENFFTGGMGITFPKKHKYFSNGLYLNYYCYSITRKSSEFGYYDFYVMSYGFSRVNTNFNVEHRLFLSKKATNRGFYLNYGLGIGNFKYTIADKVYEKNNNWDFIFGLGYKINIKHFFINTNFSLVSLFNYKYIQDYHQNISSYYNSTFAYQDESKAHSNLKSLDYDGNSIITRKYKNVGISNSTFLPRVGINIGFNF